MRTILDKKIKKITEEILFLVAKAIADTIPGKDLRHDNIIPDITNPKLQKNINSALKKF
jgi:malic enzyme